MIADIVQGGFLLLFGVFFFGGGLLMIRTGFKRQKQRNLAEETPTEDVESVSMGQSEVTGTAVPGEQGTIRAPFTDDECLVADWEIEEYDVTRDDEGTDGSWMTEAQGVEHVPFRLDDGTGQLLVRPDDTAVYDIDRDAEDYIQVRVTNTPPERIRSFEKENGVDEPRKGSSHGGNREGDRRYKQHLIRPGEDAYVFGVVQPREDQRSSANERNAVIQRVPEVDEDLEDMFMISDLDEEEIIEKRENALLFLPVGALVTTIGFGILVLAASMMLGIQLL